MVMNMTCLDGPMVGAVVPAAFPEIGAVSLALAAAIPPKRGMIAAGMRNHVYKRTSTGWVYMHTDTDVSTSEAFEAWRRGVEGPG